MFKKIFLVLLLVLLSVSLASAKKDMSEHFADLPEVSSDIPYCVDGTHFGHCSDQGFFCQQGELVPRCSKCGCPERFVCEFDVVKWGVCNEIVCFSDSECGNPGYIGNFFCQGNDVYQDFAAYTCLNPGTTDSDCKSSVSAELIVECNTNEECVDGECQVIGPEILYYDTFTDEDNTWLSNHAPEIGGLFYEAVDHEANNPSFENKILNNEMVSTAAGWGQYGMTQYNLENAGITIQPGDRFKFKGYCRQVNEYRDNAVMFEYGINEQAFQLRACGREDYYLVSSASGSRRHELSSNTAGKWTEWEVLFVDDTHFSVKVYREGTLVGELNDLLLRKGKQLSDIKVIFYSSLQDAVIDDVKLERFGPTATLKNGLRLYLDADNPNQMIDSSGNGWLLDSYHLREDSDGVINSAHDYDWETIELYSATKESLDIIIGGNKRQWSVSFWLKTLTNEYDHLISTYEWYGGGDKVYALHVTLQGPTTGRISNIIKDGDINERQLVSITNVSDGQWHHVVYTMDIPQNVMNVYVDGINEGDIQINDATYFDGNELRIGSYQGEFGIQQGFTGSLDEIGVWNRALTLSEVSLLFNEGAGFNPTSGV